MLIRLNLGERNFWFNLFFSFSLLKFFFLWQLSLAIEVFTEQRRFVIRQIENVEKSGNVCFQNDVSFLPPKNCGYKI